MDAECFGEFGHDGGVEDGGVDGEEYAMYQLLGYG